LGLSCSNLAAESSPEQIVQEYILRTSADGVTPSRWELQRDSITLGEKKVFAPANLRAAAENQVSRAQECVTYSFRGQTVLVIPTMIYVD